MTDTTDDKEQSLQEETKVDNASLSETREETKVDDASLSETREETSVDDASLSETREETSVDDVSLPKAQNENQTSPLEVIQREEPEAWNNISNYFVNHYTPEQRQSIRNTIKYDPKKNKVTWKDGADMVQATYDKNGNITEIKAVDDENDKVYKLNANASTVKYTEKSKENNSKERTKLTMKEDSVAVTKINRYIEADLSLTDGVSLHRGTHKNKTVATADGYTKQETKTDVNVQTLPPDVSYTRASNKQVYDSDGEITKTSSNGIRLDVGTRHISAGVANSSTTYTADGEETKSAYAGFDVSTHGGAIYGGVGKKEKTSDGTNENSSEFAVGADRQVVGVIAETTVRQTSADGKVIYENKTEVQAEMRKDGIAASYVHDKIDEYGKTHQNASMQIANGNINVSYGNNQSSADGSQVENKNVTLSSSPEYYANRAIKSVIGGNTADYVYKTANNAVNSANSASENLNVGNVVTDVADMLEEKLNLKKTIYSNKPKENESTDSATASTTEGQSGKQDIASQILAARRLRGY